MMNPSRLPKRSLTTITMLGLTAALGCSDGDGEEGALSEPFAICALVFGPDTLSGLIVTVPSLESGTIDLSDGIELTANPTCASAFGALFVNQFGSPILTRYERDADGRLQQTGEVSFLPTGLTSLTAVRPSSYVFLSETDALYVDRVSGTIVRWNPTEMTVTSSFTLPGLLVEGEQVTLEAVAQGPEDGSLLMYGRYAASGLFARRRALVRLDIETEEVTVEIDERCGGLASDMRASDGATYFASLPLVSTYSALELNDDPPCLVRVLPGAASFDDDFFVDMRDLTESDQIGSLLNVGDDAPLVLAYDPSVVDPGEFLLPLEWGSAVSWRVQRIDDIRAPNATSSVAGFPIQSGSVNELIEVNGRRYLVRVANDFSESSLQDITNVDDVVNGIELQGGVVVSAFDLSQ